jgi:CheY-like chemotaxis protein
VPCLQIADTLGGLVGLESSCELDDDRTVFWCAVPVGVVDGSNDDATVFEPQRRSSAKARGSAKVMPVESCCVGDVEAGAWEPMASSVTAFESHGANSSHAPLMLTPALSCEITLSPGAVACAPVPSVVVGGGGGSAHAACTDAPPTAPSLPLRREERVSAAAVPALVSGTAVDGVPLHVLVVDDEMTNRRLCDRMLRRLHCTVTCLEDGDEVMALLRSCGYLPSLPGAAGSGAAGVVDVESESALCASSSAHDLCESLPPFRRVDVVLLDIMMRRSNGVDVAVDVRRLFNDADLAMRVWSATQSATVVETLAPRFQMPPLVAMTGNTSLANIQTYKQAGFRHVLPKPFDVTGMQGTLDATVVCRGRSCSGSSW